MPSETAIQDEVFKLPAWLWLVIILPQAYFTFSLSLLHKHCFQHLCVNVRTLHSSFVHRLVADFVYLLQVVLTSRVAVAAPCAAGRSFDVLTANQFAGEQGKTSCLYKHTDEVFFCISALQGKR